ncbi:hypothetical protein [Sphingomonas sp. KC8]|uniref:hypothetical protein n=1 Tax=Sphingomonas sp. KC8 TaxID=1030157 RepID=UPI000248B8B8|nr:hypothetical protein [Sphingomonas sp. KC8]ARS28479.1 hypothetical protein KC8_14455 [Sphingomonas sp. KC8]
MKFRGNFLAAMFLCSLTASNTAVAQTGLMGGLAGFSGCVQGCMEERTISGKQCDALCRCVLTIELSRSQEELQRMQPKAKACRAKILQGVQSSTAEPLPPRNGPTSATAGRSIGSDILVCTPQYTLPDGSQSQEMAQAIASGEMKQHWTDVDGQLNGMKADKKSAFHKVAATDGIRLTISHFRSKDKVAALAVMPGNNGQCPPRHRSELYNLNEWLSKPGIRPRGITGR